MGVLSKYWLQNRLPWLPIRVITVCQNDQSLRGIQASDFAKLRGLESLYCYVVDERVVSINSG